MSDEPTSDYIGDQNRRKLEEHLKKLQEHGGKVPKLDPAEARRAQLERESATFQRDWQSWKKVYQGRIIDLSAKPMHDGDVDRKLLGVSKTADNNEIRKAFYALAKKNHPDKGGKVADFHALMDAYRNLTGEI